MSAQHSSIAVLGFRRALLEAKIEELIALLDLLDGDENLEPYLADSDPETEDREDEDEREPEDPEENGDEEDFPTSMMSTDREAATCDMMALARP